MRLHEKIGLYGFLLPIAGLILVDGASSLIESSAKPATVRTDVVTDRGRIYLTDPVCSCGTSLDPDQKGPRYWEAECPSCGAAWYWGLDLGKALAELAQRAPVTPTHPPASEQRGGVALAAPTVFDHAQVGRDGSERAITRTPVRSTALRSVGFDERASVLEVEFVSGAVYRYFGVPRAVYAELLAASSKGRYFNLHVKDAGFRYERTR